MTKKRSVVSFILAICLFVPMMFLLSACGGDNGGDTKGHVHNFECEVSTDTYLASSATCTQKSKYYYSCSCGEKSDQTFEYGDALGHTGGTASCNALAVCTRCSEPYGEYAEHTFDDGLVTQEPTCTQVGVLTKTCTVCGEKNYSEVPASHKGTWYVTAKPRCFDDGSEQRICTVCDTIENRKIPQIGHHELEEATCIAGKKCKNCHYIEGVGTGHVFPTDWTYKAGFEPTCTKSGIEEHACMVCGETEERNASMLSHDYSDWETSVNATCTENGKETRTCKSCGLVQTNPIYATGHQGTWNTTLEPTCSATGKATLTCTECYNTVEKTLSKVAHTYGDWTIVTSPNCWNEQNGQKKRTCSVCNNADTAIIPWTHSYSTDENNWFRTEPTCTTDGKIEKPCYVCGKETAKYIIKLPKLGHTGDWVIEQQPTCTQDGYKTQTCTRCNQVTNLTISKLGHNMLPGTCTTLPTCSRCGHTEGVATHDYTVISPRVIEDPDCERYGYKILTCSKCGDEQTEKIAPVGHKFSTENANEYGWVKTLEPTCTKDGKYRRTCLTCNKSFDERIMKLGHEMIDGNCTKPYHCSRCDYQQFVGHVYGENGCTECGLAYTDATYELSQDGTYYIVTAINVSGIKDVFIRPTYNSLPVKVIRCTMPSTVETVVLSNNIEVIGENAFNNCTNLTSITLGTGLNKIGENAFNYCINLKNVLFESLENWFDVELEYGSSPFAYGATIYVQGSPISEIIIPDSVTKINNRLFYGCKTITKVTCGSSVESIGEYSFAYCTNLTQVIMNNGLKTIGSDAFYFCTGLTSISIPDNVVEIGNGTFNECTSLESIALSPNNTKYASVSGILYNKEKTKFIAIPKLISGEIVIPAGITKIDMYMFNGCKNITKVTLPETIQYISRCAFEGCTNLESINIPNGVESIYGQAFKNCTSLKTLSLPATLNTIDITAFEGCSNLESITVDENNQNYSSESGILYNKAKTEIIFVPKMVSGEIVIPDTVLSIAYKIGGCSKITQLTIGAGVEDSEYDFKDKFKYMASLKKIIVSENNELYSSDDNGILCDKDKTKMIGIPRAIEGNVVIANTITQIDPGAFENCTQMTSVVIPNSVTWIGTTSFEGCTGLTSVIMEDGDNAVTYFGRHSFNGCTKLTSIRLSSNLTSMDESLFNNCKSLTSIFIPASVTEIDADYSGSSFFEGCKKDLKIYCEASSKPEGWGEYWNCYGNYGSKITEKITWGVTREQYEQAISQTQE